jgi:hypothetical protein
MFSKYLIHQLSARESIDATLSAEERTKLVGIEWHRMSREQRAKAVRDIDAGAESVEKNIVDLKEVIAKKICCYEYACFY